jgi:hypothetical protein
MADYTWLNEAFENGRGGTCEFAHTFDSLTALAECGDNGGRLRYSSSHTGTKSFTGTRDYGEAMSLVRNGWSEHRDEAKTMAQRVVANVQQTMRPMHVPVYDVSGSFVDIGAYLEGIPECMVDFQQEMAPTTGRVVTILVSAFVSCAVSRDAIVKRGVAIAALIEALACHNVSVELWSEMAGGESFTVKGGKYVSILTKVKGASDALDLDHLMFAIGHPSMFRRLYFGASETLLPSNLASRYLGFYYYPHVVTRGEEIGANVIVDGNQNPKRLTLMESDPEEWCKVTLRELGMLDEEG